MKPTIRAYSDEYWINLYRIQPSLLILFPLYAKKTIIEFLNDKIELEKYIEKPKKRSFFESRRSMLDERLSNY